MNSATSGERVLIVEDEPSTRRGLTELVSTWGFTTDSAADGEEALKRVTDFRPAIIISDLVMPRMGGLDLATRLRARYPELRVVFMSGYADRAVAARLPAGAPMLHKPFTPAALAQRVEAVLAADVVHL